MVEDGSFACLFTYFLPASYLLSLLLYCFTTCTDLLQLLGVWYSPSQLLFTCLLVFQLCALALSFVLSCLLVVVGSEEYYT